MYSPSSLGASKNNQPSGRSSRRTSVNSSAGSYKCSMIPLMAIASKLSSANFMSARVPRCPLTSRCCFPNSIKSFEGSTPSYCQPASFAAHSNSPRPHPTSRNLPRPPSLFSKLRMISRPRSFLSSRSWFSKYSSASAYSSSKATFGKGMGFGYWWVQFEQRTIVVNTPCRLW